MALFLVIGGHGCQLGSVGGGNGNGGGDNVAMLLIHS